MSAAPESKTETPVSAEDLKTLIAEAQAGFAKDPATAKASFQSSTALQEGFRSRASLRQHSLTIDEPAALGGTDSGPNPVELILAALGSCQEITYRAFATALGIPLDSVRVELTGDIDLRGFFAVDPAVRPGYEAIRGQVHLESPAAPERLEQLRQAVNGHCPVLDILANPVPIALELVVAGGASAAAA